MVVGLVYINYYSTEKIHKSLSTLLSVSKVETLVIVGDNSGEYIAFMGEEIIRFDDNLGFGRAVNLCVRKLKTEYVAIINPDTEFDSDILKASLSLFDREKVGFVSAHQRSPITKDILVTFGSLPNIYHSLLLNMPFRLVPEGLIKRYWPLRNVEGYERTFKSCYGAYLFLSTETFNELDGFDERFFLFYEETDFCKRLLDNGFTNYMLDKSITYFHDQGYSSKKVATKTNFHMIQSRKLYLIKHHGMFYAILDNLLVSLSSWKSFLRYLIS